MKEPPSNMTSISQDPEADARLKEIRQILCDASAAAADVALSDAAVMNDESKFRQRFGRGFDWGRRHREALIELKREHDLTDREIRWFWRSGNLRRTSTGVKLTAGPSWVAAWGVLQLCYLGSLVMTVVLAGWQRLLFTPMHYLPAWLMLLGIVFFVYPLYWMQVKPWLTLRHHES